MKLLLLLSSLLFAAALAHGAPPASDSPAAGAEPAQAEAAERQTVIGILHPSDIKDSADEIQLHLVSFSNGSSGIFVVDVGLESPLSRKDVELMMRRVRLAGEDEVMRVLVKLTAEVVDGERPKVTRGRITGFKARKNAERAGGAREETLVGDWPDLGFIKFPPGNQEGADAKEEKPEPSPAGPKGAAEPQ